MNQNRKNTLSSLSGFPVKGDALQGLATGNRTGKPAEREQTVYTPQCIWDVWHAVWPEGIALDPCSGPDSIGVTTDRYFAGGLETPWVERTYINPPFKDLKAWLAYGEFAPSEQGWLVPVRTHRRWWRKWRDGLDAYVELDPLAFVGFKQKFPAPLLLGYRGTRTAAFKAASSGLGTFYKARLV